ncbi:MAG: hypothetical protein KBS91_03390 [Firmicutes bacterium]|nr:hypothetical protein [Candidatus Caballimonas caccae]
MNISVVTSDSLNKIWQDNLESIGNPDITIFGFNGLGLVSYKKELSGETEDFEDLARLSKQLSSVVISGCDTDTYGIFRHSGVIADSGKILGVTDMLYSTENSEYAPGGNLRVYQTSKGRIGIVIGEDLFFSDVVNTLSICDAEIIVCLFKEIDASITKTVIKALSFCNGVDIILVSKGEFCLAESSGKIKIASRSNIVKTNININKEYRLLSFKKRMAKNSFKE